MERRSVPANPDRGAADLAQIVVGVDFSPESEDATAHAVAIARRAGARVALVHVDQVAEEPSVPASMAVTAGACRSVLHQRLRDDRRRLESLRDRWSGQGVELSHDVIEDLPDAGVAAAAHALDADLIVVGSHGRTGPRRPWLGSVAERTVRVAASSVLVARGEPRPGGYRSIIVGTDFSAASDIALDRAVALAAPGAEVLVVHGWRPSRSEIDETDETDDARRRENGADVIVASLAAGCQLLDRREAGYLTLRFDAIDAPADVGLATLARARHADLVVVGSHGRRGARRFVLGSVAEATVHHAPGSVLVAR